MDREKYMGWTSELSRLLAVRRYCGISFMAMMKYILDREGMIIKKNKYSYNIKFGKRWQR